MLGSTPTTPRFDYVSSQEEINDLMDRAKCTREDGKKVLDAEAMFKILELVHGQFESNLVTHSNRTTALEKLKQCYSHLYDRLE